MDLLKLSKPYIKRIEVLKKEKGWSNQTEKTIKKWLVNMLMSYNSEWNLENQTLEEYLAKYFDCLESLEELSILSISDIIEKKNEDTMWFYNKIQEIPEELRENMNSQLRFKKEGEKYILDDAGDYYLKEIGFASTETPKICLLEGEYIQTTLHHELEHIYQVKNKEYFKVPSCFPLSFYIMKMMYEGDAVYHEQLYEGNISFGKRKWTEVELKNFRYSFYFEMYWLLQLSIPEEFLKTWKNNNWSIETIPEHLRNRVSNIFAMICILLAKGASLNFKTVKESIDIIKKDAIQLAKGNQQSISDKNESLSKEVKKLEDILENPQEIERKWHEEIEMVKSKILEEPSLLKRKRLLKTLKQELKTGFPLEKYRSKLQEELESTRKTIEGNIKIAQSLKEMYQFLLDVSSNLETFMEENLSTPEIFQKLLEELSIVALENPNEKRRNMAFSYIQLKEEAEGKKIM